MPLVPLRILLDHAAENDYGLAAFNVNNMEQIQAILEAAKETDSPVTTVDGNYVTFRARTVVGGERRGDTMTYIVVSF